MSRFTSVFTSFVLAIAVIGCATMQSIDITSRSRLMDADYATTLRAAIDYLSSEAWQITSVDKDLGLINTEFKSISGLASILSGGERYKLNFSIRGQSSSQTRVIATMLYERRSGLNPFKDGVWTQANMTEGDAIEKYNKILAGIQSKIAECRSVVQQ